MSTVTFSCIIKRHIFHMAFYYTFEIFIRKHKQQKKQEYQLQQEEKGFIETSDDTLLNGLSIVKDLTNDEMDIINSLQEVLLSCTKKNLKLIVVENPESLDQIIWENFFVISRKHLISIKSVLTENCPKGVFFQKYSAQLANERFEHLSQ